MVIMFITVATQVPAFLRGRPRQWKEMKVLSPGVQQAMGAEARQVKAMQVARGRMEPEVRQASL